ncbi:hypothetical protein H4R18_001407 [Coemansia javaensis]|uniref:Uncharacterized protein n=1 Tax=Coemansia javaensis TaxID=2761396 RepID=A0A9W8HH72_9FUNG|nr:hypothetical protein H4R18_001407 [Coemansia javaensis]
MCAARSQTTPQTAPQAGNYTGEDGEEEVLVSGRLDVRLIIRHRAQVAAARGLAVVCRVGRAAMKRRARRRLSPTKGASRHRARL